MPKAEKNSEKGKTGLFQIIKYTYLGGLVVYIHFYIGGGNSNISLIFYITPKIGEDEAIITITITIIIILFMIFIIYIIIMIIILIALNIKNTKKCTTNSKQQERRTKKNKKTKNKNKKEQKQQKTTKKHWEGLELKKTICKPQNPQKKNKKIIPKTIPHPLYS